MQGEKRKPFTKAIDVEDLLNDRDISGFKGKLEGLKNKDFTIKVKFDEIENLLTIEEVNKLRLCKLLYCTEYRKEMFLHLGVILESRLNAVIDLYIANNWQTTANYDPTKINHQFQAFKKTKTLSEKADMINSLNLFNNTDTSDQIRYKIQGFRFLRNYGGHSKSVNEFLDIIIDSQPDCDNEINDACNLIRQIETAKSLLINNPPSIR